MTSIRVTQLEPGDLMFLYTGDAGSTPGVGRGTEPVRHAAMITRTWATGAAHQVHSMQDGVSRGDVASSVEGHAPDGRQSMFRIFRCRLDGLATAAVAQAEAWTAAYAPYDHERQSASHQMQVHLQGRIGGGRRLVREQRRLFHEIGRFRAIKFAARRDGPPNFPGEEKDTGLFCSMFVALCYQIAGLRELVEAQQAPSLMNRVSDKHMPGLDLDLLVDGYGMRRADAQDYLRYLGRIRLEDPYGVGLARTRPHNPATPGVTRTPGIAFWRTGRGPDIGAVNWPLRITEGMMVDAKSIHCGGLVESLRADEAGWRDMGWLRGPREFTESAARRAGRMNAERDARELARLDLLSR